MNKPDDFAQLAQRSDTTEEESLTNTRVYIGVGWLIVLVGLGGFILWASFARLDRGVPVAGIVAKESNRKAIQHPAGGVVDEILVSDGAVVKQGQVLVRLNKTALDAQVEAAALQYAVLRATEARLIAERDGAASISFLTDDQGVGSTLIKTIDHSQAEVFFARRSALKEELQGTGESITAIRRQLVNLRASRQSKIDQQSIIEEQTKSMAVLAEDGFVPRSRYLDLQRTGAQLTGTLYDDSGNIERSEHEIAALETKVIQRQQEYRSEVNNLLSDTKRDLEVMHSRLNALYYDLHHLDIVSPVAGTVMDLTLFTQGAVVAPGARLMEIIPVDDPLIVEAMLPVNLVDLVYPGLPVDVLFSSMNTTKTPRIEGEVEVVSADRSMDEKTNTAYYKMNVRVTPQGRKRISDEHLAIQAGMGVDMFVKTGERSLISYLSKPLMDRLGSALSED